MVEIWQSIEFWGVLVAVIAGAIGTILTKISNDTQKKSLRLESLFRIFELLKEQEQIEARKKIYDEYLKVHPTGIKKEGEGPVRFSEETKKYIARIRTSYAQINILLDRGLLEESPLMQLYADTIIRSWIALEDNTELKKKHGKKVAFEFEKLKGKAEYYITHVLNEELPVIYPNKIKL